MEEVGYLELLKMVELWTTRLSLEMQHSLNKYYAYGIRNSFGIDFDPVTGNLWDTENGPGFGDEINLVEPGFNSGWSRVQGYMGTVRTIMVDQLHQMNLMIR